MSTLEDVNRLKLWDYRIQHFDGSRLLVIGDNDLTYHHEVELVFTDVYHINCDVDFHHPQFFEMGSCGCGCGAFFTGIQAEDKDFAIAAEKLEVSLGTVFHYRCKDLQPGERIASWVDTD
ncbi:hypothetical protein [Thalassoroseus pseudoceratinae]|uniref:hypothetical protein n=1 Tax=Thalassoroseus pseudoceratinae TaxID=2713176 RepID=UPI00141E667A|nr:hypothetical protein [Thalassoroseus pseudoceratinae]